MNSTAASCTGKVPFKTFTLANNVVKRHGKDNHREAYHCQHCHQWHLGTVNGANKRSNPVIEGGQP